MVDLPGLDWVSPGYLAGSLKNPARSPGFGLVKE